MTLKEFQDLQRREQELRRAADLKTGAIQQKRKELEQEFGVRTPKDAKRLRAKLEREIADLEREADALAAAVKQQFPQLEE